MKELGLQKIPVENVDASERLRQVDPGYVAFLAENIGEIGRLRQPIEVRKVKGGYALIAGAHRFAAVQTLGWTDVPAFVFEATDDEARLAEIDENLYRNELNPLDRAVFLAEREAVYLRLHPETARGVAGGRARQGAANEIISFAQDTADRIGLTVRTVQLAVSIARGLSPAVRERISGTWLARKQSDLIALSKLEPSLQEQVVEALLADEPAHKSVAAAADAVQGRREADAKTDHQKQLDKLMTAWRHAAAPVQRAFLDHLTAEGVVPPVTEEAA